MNEILMIGGMMIVTFIPRYGVLALLGKVEMPKPMFQALRFVPPAVLAAIILPAVVLKPEDSSLFITPENSYLIAGIIGAIVAWRSKNVLLTIIVGMAALFIWRWLLATIAGN